jgi:hypothetical protein
MTTETNPTRPAMTDAEAEAEARQIIAAAYQPTSYRDTTPIPTIGTAPPVAQPGRPPMSQGATDASVLMIAGAGSVSMVSLSAGVLMYLSQYANPVVCGVVFGAPTVLVLALSRLVRHVKQVVEAAPPVIQQTYTGAVYQDQRNVQTRTSGVWARTNNQQ